MKSIYSIFFVLIGAIQLILASSLEAQAVNNAETRLQKIHSQLKLLHGNLMEEYPEQLMTAMYLPRQAKVLELGGNVGRNSCVIASILKNSQNLVTVEPCAEYANLLKENRDVNGLQFHIEVSAVSKIPLVQSGWITIPSEVDLPGFSRVNTISFDELQKKYRIRFDTLVVDCEGALYYMLKDDPDMLRNIKLIIIENDFTDTQNMVFVHDLFKQYGLQLVYNQEGGWGPCYHHFYQVWKR